MTLNGCRRFRTIPLEEMTMRRIVPLLTLLALLPVALDAQSAEERIEAAQVRAQSAGIPASLLDAKVTEGKAKGVDMDRIAAAVERQAVALMQAQAAMAGEGQVLSEADLAAGADALGLGISAEILSTLSETAPQERRAVAVTALSALVALEIAPQEALDRVIEALERGPEALASLPGQAAEAMGWRGPPAGVGPASGGAAGPPAAVPTPGQEPGAANPTGAGRPGGRPGGL
jgi:hypothetical protein